MKGIHNLRQPTRLQTESGRTAVTTEKTEGVGQRSQASGIIVIRFAQERRRVAVCPAKSIIEGPMRGTSTRSVAAMPHASAKEEKGTMIRFANGEIQHRRGMPGHGGVGVDRDVRIHPEQLHVRG